MSPTRYYLTNRALEVSGGGWIHIVPKGELANEAAGIDQVLDDVALDSIEQNLERDRAALGDRWPGLYVGREHFVYDPDQDSAALGWLKEFQRRPDGIWANAAGLTPAGRQAVANAEYKFTSFVADRKDTQPLGGKRHRILRVDTIGFTNQANGKELLTPITNRGEPDALTPLQASEQFNTIVNRTKNERGWNFQQAWDFCRNTDEALFNRMNGPQAPAAPRTPRAPVPAPAPAQPPAQTARTIYDSVARLVVNRLKQDFNGFNLAHALVGSRNRDLFEKPYETFDTARNFGQLVNRVSYRTRLPPVAATSQSADDVAALTRRFAPELANRHAALQWDVLWRAAEALEAANVPERICNRVKPDEVTKAEWKAANARAEDVFSFLHDEAVSPVDRGHILEHARPPQIRGVFRGAISRLMREQSLTCRAAFDFLKANEPIFWAMSMLSFEP